MAYRFYPGKSKTWLETKLSETTEQLVSGKMTTAAGAGDTSGSFQRETNLRAVQQQLIWDLSKVDPGAGWEEQLLPTVTRGVFKDFTYWP